MESTTLSRLGHYELIEAIGAGGMGEVYRAHDTRLGRDVAIKLLPAKLSSEPESLARFLQEAKAIAALTHPNILAIYDFGEEEGVSFAVTELLEGQTLRKRIRESSVPPSRAIEVAIALAEGLSAAHVKGIIHRDIKPENIFLTSDGRVKILDFGLAVPRSDFSSSDEQADVPTTPHDPTPATLAGTVGYMAPEQLRGVAAGVTSDIFSLGCVLHEMLTGRTLFLRDSVAATVMSILTDEPPSLIEKGVSYHLDRVILHCLEKNPEQRFQSARDLAFALRAAMNDRAAPLLSKRRKKSIDSLAVLPFENAGSDPALEYLSDGIPESIINNVSQVAKLRVVPRSTVFRYKGRDLDPVTIGRHLDVRAVMTGRVHQRSDRLNVQVELIDVQTESQLWGDQYSMDLGDMSALQEDIATTIVEKLKLKLSGEQKRQLARRNTRSSAAYQLYLKGRYYWNKRTEEGMKRGVGYFHDAIAEDPEYALAYSGLSDSYAVLGYYSYIPPLESFPQAREAALRALELDNTLSEAHTSLAEVRYLHAWDWAGSEREFRRAIKLNPNYATAHHWYGLFLAITGRPAEASVEMKLAEQLDPLSLIINTNAGTVHYYGRKYLDAVEQFKRAIDMDPSFGVAHFRLGEAYERLGDATAAVEELKKAIALTGGSHRMFAVLAYAHASGGQREEAMKIVDELTALSRKRYVSPYDLATIYVGLGEHEQALQWLELAFKERSHWLVGLKTDPKLEPLYSDSRFVDLQRRVGVTW